MSRGEIHVNILSLDVRIVNMKQGAIKAGLNNNTRSCGTFSTKSSQHQVRRGGDIRNTNTIGSKKQNKTSKIGRTVEVLSEVQ